MAKTNDGGITTGDRRCPVTSFLMEYLLMIWTICDEFKYSFFCCMGWIEDELNDSLSGSKLSWYGIKIKGNPQRVYWFPSFDLSIAYYQHYHQKIIIYTAFISINVILEYNWTHTESVSTCLTLRGPRGSPSIVQTNQEKSNAFWKESARLVLRDYYSLKG